MAGASRHRTSGGGATYATSLAQPTGGSLAATPAHSSFNTTDVDVRVRVAPSTWPPASNGTVGGQTNNTTRRWSLFLLDTGKPSMALTTNGGSGYTYKACGTAITSSTGMMISLRGVIDVDNGASGYDVKFYTRSDAAIDSNAGWTQLGSTVTVAGTITLPTTTAALDVGADDSADGPIVGNYARLVLMSGIGGTVVADFDATKVVPTGTQLPTTYTDTTGKVWTVSGTGWAWNT